MRTLLVFFFFFCHTARLSGSQFPDQGLNLGPWQWKPRILTTRQPGNFQLTVIYLDMVIFYFFRISAQDSTLSLRQSSHRVARFSSVALLPAVYPDSFPQSCYHCCLASSRVWNSEVSFSASQSSQSSTEVENMTLVLDLPGFKSELHHLLAWHASLGSCKSEVSFVRACGIVPGTRQGSHTCCGLWLVWHPTSLTTDSSPSSWPSTPWSSPSATSLSLSAFACDSFLNHLPISLLHDCTSSGPGGEQITQPNQIIWGTLNKAVSKGDETTGKAWPGPESCGRWAAWQQLWAWRRDVVSPWQPPRKGAREVVLFHLSPSLHLLLGFPLVLNSKAEGKSAPLCSPRGQPPEAEQAGAS